MKKLLAILRKFCDEDLDQWERFKFEADDGMVYVSISREPLDGGEDSYDLVKGD